MFQITERGNRMIASVVPMLSTIFHHMKTVPHPNTDYTKTIEHYMAAMKVTGEPKNY